jgi:hypothetical protein
MHDFCMAFLTIFNKFLWEILQIFCGYIVGILKNLLTYLSFFNDYLTRSWLILQQTVSICYQKIWWIVYQNNINYASLLQHNLLVFSCRLFDKPFAIFLWVYIGNTYDFTSKFMIIYESFFNMVCHWFCNNIVSLYYYSGDFFIKKLLLVHD